MKDRRSFLKIAAAAPAAGLAALSTGTARADDSGGGPFVASWSMIHDLPPGFPAPSFREFLSIAAGGVLHETNSFLHTASNLALPGVPYALNASDGVGNWKQAGGGRIAVEFRKMVFDGHSGLNVGDLYVQGTLYFVAGQLTADWNAIQLEIFNTQPIDLTFGMPLHSHGGVRI
jgi:hypothetical protein